MPQPQPASAQSHASPPARNVAMKRAIANRHHFTQPTPHLVSLRTQLASPLFASLVQVVELVSRALRADLAAGRIHAGPDHVPDTHLNAAPLCLMPDAESAMADWLHDERSAFALVRDWHHRQILAAGELPRVHPPLTTLSSMSPHAKTRPAANTQVFRVSTLVQQLHPRSLADNLYEALEPYAVVRDAVGLVLPMTGITWATLLFLRAEPNPPFTPESELTLANIAAPMAAALRRGQQDEAAAAGHLHDSFLQPADTRRSRASLVALLMQLSRTERRILRLLRRGHTERAVAAHLNRSPHTVHVHVKSIYRKLSINSRQQLRAIFE